MSKKFLAKVKRKGFVKLQVITFRDWNDDSEVSRIVKVPINCHHNFDTQLFKYEVSIAKENKLLGLGTLTNVLK
jgi:hypothetical protein